MSLWIDLWRLSSRIPLTTFLHWPRRPKPSLYSQKSTPWIYSPSSSLQSPFRTLHLPSFLAPPEGCPPKTPFCGRRRTEIQRTWRTPTLQPRVLGEGRAASHATMEKIVLIMKDPLWGNDINLVEDVPMIYIKFIVIENVISEKI